MKNLFKTILKFSLSVILCTMMSCKTDEPTNIPGDYSGIFDNAMRSAIVDWGTNMDDVRTCMQGFVPVKSLHSDELYFEPEDKSYCIAYGFKENKLCATSIIISKYDFEGNNLIFKDFSQIGILNNATIYENQNKNLFLSYWEEISNSQMMAIGLSPISSDLYEKIEPYGVTTQDIVEINNCGATVKGELFGTDSEVEVGVIYGQTSDIDIDNSRKVSVNQKKGAFEIRIKGLVDDVDYYCKTYAIVDKRVYYGELKQFHSDNVLTYKIDGKEFKMIKVEGGPYGDFSIMQTEVPPNSKFEICGVEFDRALNDNDDYKTTLYESTYFINKLEKITGLYWRYPTSSEWKFAANGGVNDDGFIYSGSDNSEDVAWHNGNCPLKAQGVALKNANSLGIYDMSGNYGECVNDDQIPDLEKNNIKDNKQGYMFGTVAFGGSWCHSPEQCTINSSFPTNKEKYALEAKNVTIRLVYSRNQ